MDGCAGHTSAEDRSSTPCDSTTNEDTSEAFEDAQSELEKDNENPQQKVEYDAIDEIKVASPLRHGMNTKRNNDHFESVVLLKEKRSYSVAGCENNFPLELPPLESFLDTMKFDGLNFSEVICGSLAGSLELENDILPSTPLTDEQLRHADSVLKDEMVQGVPINRIEVEQPPLGNFITVYLYELKETVLHGTHLNFVDSLFRRS